VKLIAWLKRRKVEGFDLMLWSARGRQHCLRAVEEFGLDGLFDVITGKPGYIVDDKGWAWIKFTKVVTNFEK
jgi:phosphoglycolate phosphatase-like HAD superfamily hydrolase